MNDTYSRRRFLQTCSAAACVAGIAPTQALAAPAAAGGTAFRIVNATGGAFADKDCHWSLDHGKTWESLAVKPRFACPTGNGRLYFHLGPPPKNFDDREAIWDFIEYAYADGMWHGNTTQVDAFCIPTTISLGSQKVGLAVSRKKLFESFRRDCPKEFAPCVPGDKWILSPCRAGFAAGGPQARYFDAYLDEVWKTYARETKTPSGKFVGRVEDGALVFAPTSGTDKPLRCDRKPSTQDAFLGTGVLAANPQFCAAINRHVLADPADWRSGDKFYLAQPSNWYARFFHEHSLDRKAYGFCYDDVAEQAAFFSGRGEEVVVTLSWD